MYPSYDVTGNKPHPYRRDGLVVEQMESLSSMDRDQADLARLGKKSVLKVRCPIDMLCHSAVRLVERGS